jgi:hypothetical protein
MRQGRVNDLEKMESMYYSNENFLIKSLSIREINFEVLWNEMRCDDLTLAAIAIFIGPSSGESALG